MSTELTAETIIAELRKASWVMVTTQNSDGNLVSHPMTPQRVDDDGVIWFFVSTDSNQADALGNGSAVNIAIAENGKWISVAGSVAFSDNDQLFDELWNDSVAAWFGDDGKAGAQLVSVTAESAQMWGMPGNSISAGIQMVLGKLTGTPTAGGSQTTGM